MEAVTTNSTVEELEKYLVYHYLRYNLNKRNTSKKRLEFAVCLLNKKSNSDIFENGYGWLNHNIFIDNPEIDINEEIDSILKCMLENKINVDLMYVEHENMKFSSLDELCKFFRISKEEPEVKNEEKVEEMKEQVKEDVKKEEEKQETKQGSKMGRLFKYGAIIAVTAVVAVAGKVAFDKYKG